VIPSAAPAIRSRHHAAPRSTEGHSSPRHDAEIFDGGSDLRTAPVAAAARRATDDDIAFMVAGETDVRRIAVAADLAAQPLWPYGTPLQIRAAWSRLKAMLLVRKDENWEVWTDWYEDRLAGHPADRELEVARILMPYHRRETAEAFNARIRQLIEEHKQPHVQKAELTDEASLPTQTPRAAIFQRDANEVIGLAPPGPRDRLADTPDIRDFYDEVRDKLDSLISLGQQVLGSRLDDKVKRFRSYLPEAMPEAIERRVWSSGNTMRSILAAHNAVAHEDFHPDKLDHGAAERLRDLVETFNQLAFADPLLRQRDTSRPGPQEYQRTIDQIKTVIHVVDEAAGSRAITNAEASDELAESVAVVKDSKSDLFGRLGVEHALRTIDNFFTNLLTNIYRWARGIAELSRGKGELSRRSFLAAYTRK
jgi:hypothetical protein